VLSTRLLDVRSMIIRYFCTTAGEGGWISSALGLEAWERKVDACNISHSAYCRICSSCVSGCRYKATLLLEHLPDL